jgi:hypothetical protein
VLGVARFVGTGPFVGEFSGNKPDEIVVQGKDFSYEILNIPVVGPRSLPLSIGLPLLIEDIDKDGRADIISRSREGDSPLVITLSNGD